MGAVGALGPSAAARSDLPRISWPFTPTDGGLRPLRPAKRPLGHVKAFTRPNDRLGVITRQDAPTVGVKGQETHDKPLPAAAQRAQARTNFNLPHAPQRHSQPFRRRQRPTELGDVPPLGGPGRASARLSPPSWPSFFTGSARSRP